MRTTLRLDDDVLRAARSIAAERNQTVGEVISDLARSGLKPRLSSRDRRGIPVFEVTADVPPLTPEMVREALADSP